MSEIEVSFLSQSTIAALAEALESATSSLTAYSEMMAHVYSEATESAFKLYGQRMTDFPSASAQAELGEHFGPHLGYLLSHFADRSESFDNPLHPWLLEDQGSIGLRRVHTPNCQTPSESRRQALEAGVPTEELDGFLALLPLCCSFMLAPEGKTFPVGLFSSQDGFSGSGFSHELQSLRSTPDEGSYLQIIADKCEHSDADQRFRVADYCERLQELIDSCAAHAGSVLISWDSG
jgi:hypothetical protein